VKRLESRHAFLTDYALRLLGMGQYDMIMQQARFEKAQLKALRATLLDQQQFLGLATHFIRKAAELEGSDDEQFCEYYKVAMQAVTAENTASVSAIAASPIERTFLNSLILTFIKSDGLGLLVHPTSKNSPAEIDEFRRDLNHFKEFVSWFKKNKPADTMEDYLDQVVRQGGMSREERDYFTLLIFRYRYIPLDNSYHMTLQPRFPDIKVEGRGIRADIYFWIPSKPQINIIVECDGYQYHSDKEAFKRDRQRDRALKARGYDVLRYTGSEIFNDPVNTSYELATYLWDRAKAGPTGELA
jgi:hypothetical protein